MCACVSFWLCNWFYWKCWWFLIFLTFNLSLKFDFVLKVWYYQILNFTNTNFIFEEEKNYGIYLDLKYQLPWASLYFSALWADCMRLWVHILSLTKYLILVRNYTGLASFKNYPQSRHNKQVYLNWFKLFVTRYVFV